MKNMTLLIVGGAIVAGAGIFLLKDDAPQTTAPGAANNAQGAPLAQVVLPDSFTDTEKLGEAAFNATCATCHGTNAAGQDGVAPPLVHKIYEPSHHGDQAFLLAAANGVRAHHWPFGNMPPVEGLTNADVRNIVAYVRSLQRANGIN